MRLILVQTLHTYTIIVCLFFSVGEAESAQILTGTFSTAHSRGDTKGEVGVHWLRRLQNAIV